MTTLSTAGPTTPAIPPVPATAAPTPDTRLSQEIRVAGMVWERELIRYTRNRTRIVSGLMQPVLFLFVLGYGMGSLVGSTGGFDFRKFVFPGVVAMSVVMTAMFSAISIVWDREFGFLREMLVAPVSRMALVLGKTAGGATVAATQGTIMLVLAPLVGVRLTPLLVVEVIALELLLAVMPTTFAVAPLRQGVFAAQDMTPAAQARFAAGVTVFGHTLPIVVDVGVVVAFSLVFFGLAVRGLSRTE